MTKLQEKLLALLIEIDEICKRHGISYMLFAGTALGAERHHGFIPWDDDADIIMTLDNYEKFIKVTKKELRPDRALNALENDTDGYFLTYARYVDLNTTAIQRHTAFGGCDPGVKVDIFCVVPTYDKMEKAEVHKQHILAFSETILPYGLMHPNRADGFFPLFEEEQRKLKKLGREKYIRKSLRKLKRGWRRHPKYYALFSGMMSDSYLLDAKLLDEVKYVPFEHTKLPVSAHNIAFSKALYGEGWINIPDNVERPRHMMLLDLERPFTAYMEHFRNSDTYAEKKELARHRRELHLYEREAFRDVVINRQKTLNLFTELQVTEQYENLAEKEKENVLLLEKIFSPYYQMQLQRNNRYYRLPLTLPEHIFQAAMNHAVHSGKHDVALEILKIGKDAGYVAETQYDKYDKRITQCVDIIETMYLKRDTKALQDLLEGVKDPLILGSLPMQTAQLWLQFKACRCDEDFSMLQGIIDEKKAVFGEIGELTALQGLCLEKQGKISDAFPYYQKAIKSVRNAVVFQQLMEKGADPYEK